MIITVDTNVLVRLFVCADDEDMRQRTIAKEILEEAKQLVIPTSVFCETVWVLPNHYKIKRDNILSVLENFIKIPKIHFQKGEIAAGLALMRLGGDFADGVNEYTGTQMGSEQFITFDKKAAKLLIRQGKNVRLLS